MCSDAFHSQRLQEHASDPERTGIRVLRVRRLGRCWEACHFAARHRLRSYRSARDGRARIGRGRPIDVFRALANGLLQPLRARKRREASRDREARPRHRAPLRRNAVRGRRRRDRRDQARGGHAGGAPSACPSNAFPCTVRARRRSRRSGASPASSTAIRTSSSRASNTLRTAGGGGASPFWT